MVIVRLVLLSYYLLNHYRVFTDILFGVLLYYMLFVQSRRMAPASKGALLNIHYYYYYKSTTLNVFIHF